MKILQINKFHHPQGGADTHYLTISKLLEEKGHEVSNFSMQDEKNLPCKDSKYFVSNLDIEHVKLSPKNILKVISRFIYNREAAKKIEELIKDKKPDIAHIHNIYHHLTPSILVKLKKYNIPVVMTVHDHKLICPNYGMFQNGELLDYIKKYKYYLCVKNKCVKDSYAASLLSSIELGIHKLFKLYDNYIDIAITPSRYLKDKLIDWGVQIPKIIHMPNFIDVDKWKPSNITSSEKKIIYIGRLSAEKGIYELLKAWKKKSATNGKLLIIGDGPEEEKLKKLAEDLGIMDSTEFVGRIPYEEVQQNLSDCLATVTPSIYYENYPMTIVEPFAMGKPVIGSNIGGIPEAIKDGERGYTFEPRNIEELAQKLDMTLKNPEKADQMGKNARKWAEKNLSWEKYYQELMNLYHSLIQK